MEVSGKKGMRHKEVKGRRQIGRWEGKKREVNGLVGGKALGRLEGQVGVAKIYMGSRVAQKKNQKGCLGKKIVN
jgi:hypothetical protein